MSKGDKVIAFYVSTDGNDRWSGKFPSPNTSKTDGPFASITGARNAIRKLKSKGTFRQPVEVIVRKGTYYLSKAITFEPQDSGRESCPIVYKAAPGEKVVISGGKKISGWNTVDGKIWKLHFPEVKKGKWYFRQLFVNGKRQVRSRIPDKGYYFVDVDGIDPEERRAFKFKKGDIKRWKNLKDIEVVIFRSWDESRLKISRLNEKKRIAIFTGSAGIPFKKFCGEPYYYIENVLEGLNGPWKWYLDRHSGNLYYWPSISEDMEKLEVVASVLKQLVCFKGNSKTGEYVHDLTLNGFIFSHADWSLPEKGYPGFQADLVEPSAIGFERARHCIFKDNTIVNTGNYGITLGRGCKDNKVAGNTIEHLGSGGIKIGEETRERAGHHEPFDLPLKKIKETELTSHNIISNNHIHHCGTIYPGAVGIWVGQSSDNLISHNLIHDIGYSGISIGWTWADLDTRCKRNIIECNEIYNVMQIQHDGAGIYTLGRSDGTIIRNNLIHDIYAPKINGPKRYGESPAMGIYLDESSQNMRVENNIVYRAQYGLHLHEAFNNVITNNVFVGMSKGYIRAVNSYKPSKKKNVFIRNIIYGSNSCAVLYYFRGCCVENVMSILDKSLIFNSGHPLAVDEPPAKALWSNWKEKRIYERHSKIADPLFVNLQNDNFMLRHNSPAFNLGFKQIETTGVGIRRGKIGWQNYRHRIKAQKPVYNEEILKTFCFSDKYYVIGYFDNLSSKKVNMGLKKIFLPENRINLQAEYQGKGGQKIRWIKLERKELGIDNFINIRGLLGEGRDAVSYIYTEFESKKDKKRKLLVGSNGSDIQICIWLNGEKVMKFKGYWSPEIDQESTDVIIRKGNNRLLIKMSYTAGACGLFVRLDRKI